MGPDRTQALRHLYSVITVTLIWSCVVSFLYTRESFVCISDNGAMTRADDLGAKRSLFLYGCFRQGLVPVVARARGAQTFII